MITVKDRLALLDDVLPKGGVVAEVGVARGAFAEQILLRSQPKRLHLIDIWLSVEKAYAKRPDDSYVKDHEQTQRRLRSGIRSGQVVIHQGWSVPCLKLLPCRQFDWIYVDADHEYDSVLADLKQASYCIRVDGGFLVGHDYQMDSVRSAVDAFIAASRKNRAKWELHAVTEFDPKCIDEAVTGCSSYVLRRAK